MDSWSGISNSRRLNTSTRFSWVTGSGHAVEETGPIAPSMSAIQTVSAQTTPSTGPTPPSSPICIAMREDVGTSGG